MTTKDADVTALFLDYSRRKLIEQDWPRLQSAVATLTEEQLWWRPNAASNSIGNLILHLDGNMRQYLVASFNRQTTATGHPNSRRREQFRLPRCSTDWAQRLKRRRWFWRG
jgi:hypothetical protein